MDRTEVLTVAGLGVMAGMRSLSAPAVLSQRLSKDSGKATGGLDGMLSSKLGSRTLTVLALGELVGDKLPGIPARIAPPALTFRLLSGAVVGASLARRNKRPVLGPILIGAVSSLASAFALYGLRELATKQLRIPNVLAGLLEDMLVATAGTRVMAALK